MAEATDPPKVGWMDSNILHIDSKVENRIEESSSNIEWRRNVGKKEGLYIWRMEKFRAVVWPKRKFGKFYRGDSYLVLHSEYSQDDNKNKLHHNVHMWIGSESTHDEYSTALYKMIELCNTSLRRQQQNSIIIQHREIQEQESIQFSSYFQDHLTYLRGGVNSGFLHHSNSDADEEPRLYHIKGISKTLRMTQKLVQRDSLNAGDVFILVVGTSVWLWVGEESNPDEKQKGMNVAKTFPHDDRLIVLEQGINDGEKQAPDFWKYLPGKINLLGPLFQKSLRIKDADERDSKVRAFRLTIYRIGLVTGTLKKDVKSHHRRRNNNIAVVGSEEEWLVFRQDLQSSNMYLLDTGFHVFVWIGKKVDPESVGSKPIRIAHDYFKKYRRPNFPVTVLYESAENNHFRSFIDESTTSNCEQCVIL